MTDTRTEECVVRDITQLILELKTELQTSIKESEKNLKT